MSKPILYGDPARWVIVQSDTLKLLPELPPASVDVIVTDPPYGLDMGDGTWDGGALTDGRSFERWTAAWAESARRVLKPGGYLAAFGSSRTFHRLVAGVEDADFEVRDQLLWLYGTGVPKSRRRADGLGSTLKPAYEPILLARRPLRGTLDANLAAHGTGALQIDAARVPAPDRAVGFWPANVAFEHSPECSSEACREPCPAPLIDAETRSAARPSRLFYAPKASQAEREAGCESLPARVVPIYHRAARRQQRVVRNIHPTVKPLALMRWLIRLVCPPGGTVFDPFCGSGSTGAAAMLEGRRFVGVERDAAYVEIAMRRIEHWAAREGA